MKAIQLSEDIGGSINNRAEQIIFDPNVEKAIEMDTENLKKLIAFPAQKELIIDDNVSTSEEIVR